MFVLILIPLTAIAIYTPFRLLELYPATNIVLYVVTMPLGFRFFFRAVWCHKAQGMHKRGLRETNQEGTE